MFKIPIYGDIDGKSIRIYLGNRYKIITKVELFEGTITKCIDSRFLIKTTEGGHWVNFDDIEDIVTVHI